MYLQQWSLTLPPFAAEPDSRFLFPATQHERALAVISYAVCDGGEPALLSGPPGCGKTLLLRTLRRRLPREDYRVAFVPATACNQTGLLTRVAWHLTHEMAASRDHAMNLILDFIEDDECRYGTIVLMLDDFPLQPSADALEELRWLLALTPDDAAVRLLMTCDDECGAPAWPAWLMQRLFARARVGPLPRAQIAAYLRHRLQAGGCPRPDIFDPAAAERIADWSLGVPRLISRAAHLALSLAQLERSPRVTAKIMEAALGQLLGDADTTDSDAPRTAPQLRTEPAP